ncbi:MAG: hypothetical protein ABIK10_05120 [candidate division WOR-3 bacterium]
MKLSKLFAILLLMMFINISCYRILLPPKIDLRGYENIGIVQFKCSEAPKLEALITQKFILEITKDQKNLGIIELGPEKELLAALNLNVLNPDAYREIATKYNVSSIFLGELIISDVKPSVMINPGLSYVGARGIVDADIIVKFIDLKSQKIIWTNTAKTRREVGHIGFVSGKFTFDAQDPQAAYGPMAEELVRKVTKDFKRTYKYRCCPKHK